MITHEDAERVLRKFEEGYGMILDIEGKEVLNVALMARKGRLSVTITAGPVTCTRAVDIKDVKICDEYMRFDDIFLKLRPKE